MDVVARYVARIEEVARAEKGLGATLLLAHSYTRYFGDLSGGQFISLQLQKNWNLPGFEGREFYHFADISDIREFKNLYLANADKMAETILDSKKKEDQIVDEALKVYRMNDAMLSACMGKEAHVAGDEDKSYRAFRAAGRVEYGHGIRSKQFNEAVWIEVGRMEQVDHRTETARRLIALMIAGSVGLLLVVLRDWSWAGFSWF